MQEERRLKDRSVLAKIPKGQIVYYKMLRMKLSGEQRQTQGPTQDACPSQKEMSATRVLLAKLARTRRLNTAKQKPVHHLRLAACSEIHGQLNRFNFVNLTVCKYFETGTFHEDEEDFLSCDYNYNQFLVPHNISHNGTLEDRQKHALSSRPLISLHRCFLMTPGSAG